MDIKTEKTQLISSKRPSNHRLSWLFGKGYNSSDYELFQEDYESQGNKNIGARTLALSSNGAVEGGGVYFMLSRTLGPEFGGAIGTLFFFANVVSSALYLAGCTEGLVSNFKFLARGPWIEFLYSTSINSLNLFICLVGSKFFGKTSVLIFFMVLVCVLMTSVSFFLDYTITEDFIFNATDPLKCVQPSKNDTNQTPNCTLTSTGKFTGIGSWNETILVQNFYDNLYPKYEYDCSGSDKSLNFFIIFGVLFSGVTGIMSGANMCGELVSPSKSIPRGTISACGFTLVIYIILTVLTSLTCSPTLLQHDCMYMNIVNVLPPAVTIGVFMATFSASLNNLIGASRILEAIAKDVVFGPLINYYDVCSIPTGVLSAKPLFSIKFENIFYF
ncbi:SLC12A9 [Lepeophtheirus salmonis]|uniref:Solute carrier family 12 member 9 n=1 Tax=Lepeophtheirus salmonis TaxID=72036 RepID=A0A7R8D6B3_LEPSM|nr:SLC12A9 [Lepeophtheirus salmonis]CAF3014425.1 SLC12A9 [Lepeophtheirus salmonis]